MSPLADTMDHLHKMLKDRGAFNICGDQFNSQSRSAYKGQLLIMGDVSANSYIHTDNNIIILGDVHDDAYIETEGAIIVAGKVAPSARLHLSIDEDGDRVGGARSVECVMGRVEPLSIESVNAVMKTLGQAHPIQEPMGLLRRAFTIGTIALGATVGALGIQGSKEAAQADTADERIEVTADSYSDHWLRAIIGGAIGLAVGRRTGRRTLEPTTLRDGTKGPAPQ